MTLPVSQQGASAHGDVVGRDKIEHYHPASASPGVVQQLLEKLQAEIDKNEKVRHTVEALAHFQSRRSHDGIDGLEAKLKAGHRTDEYLSALEKKELFAKLLEKWSLYASAQEIFAFLLAKAEYEFNYFIYPQIVELDQLASISSSTTVS
jgi:vacuolar-type H+-ATPase subunit I/STV1